MNTALTSEKAKDYCARAFDNMNQWFVQNKVEFPSVKSLQIEIRKDGFRGAKNLDSTAKKIADSISALVPPEKEATKDKAHEPELNSPMNIDTPSIVGDIIDEKDPISSQPAGEEAAAEADTESATEEEIPAQDTAQTQKMTEADDREDAINVGEKASKKPEVENAMVEVKTEAQVADEDPLVSEAYSTLFGIFSKNYENAMMEAGRYLIQTFYGNSNENARNYNSPREETLNQLYKKIDKNKDGLPSSKSKMYRAVSLVIQEDDLKVFSPSTFSTLPKLMLSHKIYLLSVKDLEKKRVLIEKIVQEQLTVRELQSAKQKIESKDPTPLFLINHPEKLDVPKNIEIVSIAALKNQSPIKNILAGSP